MLPSNVNGLPDHETAPVKPDPGVIEVTGETPVTGGVTPVMKVEDMDVSVTGNTAVITPELTLFVALVDPAIVNWLAVTPVRV